MQPPNQPWAPPPGVTPPFPNQPWSPQPMGGAPKRRKWPIVLGVIVVVLLLLIGGCGLLIRKGVGALTAPVDASNAWLDAAQPAQNATLRQLTCGGSERTVATMLRELNGAGFTGTQRLSNSSIVNDAATVSGTISTAKGNVPIAFDLAHGSATEGRSGWCVQSLNAG